MIPQQAPSSPTCGEHDRHPRRRRTGLRGGRPARRFPATDRGPVGILHRGDLQVLRQQAAPGHGDAQPPRRRIPWRPRGCCGTRGHPDAAPWFVVDAAAAYFNAHKQFSALIRQVQGGAAILGPVLDSFTDDVHGRYGQAMSLMTELIAEGQDRGEIRSGEPRALAHLASVLTNEYVFADLPLTRDQFHALFEGALRAAESAGFGRPC